MSRIAVVAAVALLVCLPGYGQSGCTLTDAAIVAPLTGSTVYVTPGAESMKVPFAVWTNCPADTSEVTFTLDGALLASVTTAGGDGLYHAVSAAVYLLGYGQHTLEISAARASSLPVVFEASSVFYVASASEDADVLGIAADSNGLPDAGFEYLINGGDGWLDARTVESTGARRLTAVSRWDGSGPGVVTVYDPLAPAQYVTVTAPADLLRAGETALIILQTAPDLATLYGAVEASIFAAEPGTLPAAGRYVEASVAVSIDGGSTFLEAAPSRLAAHPVHVTIGGLQFGPEEEPDLYAHPTHVQQNTAQGLHVIAWEGTWTTSNVRNFDVDGGTVDADMVSLSALAPFEGLTSPPLVSVSPSTSYPYIYGFVEVGTYKDAVFTVTNAGGAVLTGEAMATAPFSIVSDSSYSLAAGASKQIVVRFMPTADAVATGSVTFSGGGGATLNVVGTGYEDAPPDGCTAAAAFITPSGSSGGGTGALMAGTAIALALLAAKRPRRARTV